MSPGVSAAHPEQRYPHKGYLSSLGIDNDRLDSKEREGARPRLHRSNTRERCHNVATRLRLPVPGERQYAQSKRR